MHDAWGNSRGPQSLTRNVRCSSAPTHSARSSSTPRMTRSFGSSTLTRHRTTSATRAVTRTGKRRTRSLRPSRILGGSERPRSSAELQYFWSILPRYPEHLAGPHSRTARSVSGCVKSGFTQIPAGRGTQAPGERRKGPGRSEGWTPDVAIGLNAILRAWRRCRRIGPLPQWWRCRSAYRGEPLFLFSFDPDPTFDVAWKRSIRQSVRAPRIDFITDTNCGRR